MEISKIIFDTDCLSSFLWTDKLDILYKLFGQSIKIPQAVYKELEYLKKSKNYPEIFPRIENAINTKKIEILEISIGSEVDIILEEIRENFRNDNNGKEIGDGEAEMLALAKYHKLTCATVTASNNNRDIYKIVEKENLKNITTMDILCEAYKHGINELLELENIKNQMVARRRHLPLISVYDKLIEKGYIEE